MPTRACVQRQFPYRRARSSRKGPDTPARRPCAPTGPATTRARPGSVQRDGTTYPHGACANRHSRPATPRAGQTCRLRALDGRGSADFIGEPSICDVPDSAGASDCVRVQRTRWYRRTSRGRVGLFLRAPVAGSWILRWMPPPGMPARSGAAGCNAFRCCSAGESRTRPCERSRFQYSHLTSLDLGVKVRVLPLECLVFQQLGQRHVYGRSLADKTRAPVGVPAQPDSARRRTRRRLRVLAPHDAPAHSTGECARDHGGDPPGRFAPHPQSLTLNARVTARLPSAHGRGAGVAAPSPVSGPL